MSEVTYRHTGKGAWLALAHGREVLALKAPVPDATLAELWSAVTNGSGTQAILDALTRGGLSSTPPFALLQWSGELVKGDSTLKIILRGEIDLTVRQVSGSLMLSGRDVSTWLEQSIDAVLGFDLALAELSRADAALVALPLTSAAVWTARVSVGAAGITPPVAAPAPASAAAPADRADEPVAPITFPAKISETTEIQEFTSAPLAPSPTSSEYDRLFGETEIRTVEDAAVRGEGEDSDGLEHTRALSSEDRAKSSAARKARRAVTAAAPGPSYFLQLPTGAREPITGLIVIGRAPSVSQVPGSQIPRLLTIAGPDQDISRNHAQVSLEGGTVVVTDLNSRNGTQVIFPGRSPQTLRPDEPTVVLVDTMIDLGGGVVLTIGQDPS